MTTVKGCWLEFGDTFHLKNSSLIFILIRPPFFYLVIFISTDSNHIYIYIFEIKVKCTFKAMYNEMKVWGLGVLHGGHRSCFLSVCPLCLSLNAKTLVIQMS